mgnify:CR=1 FL=1
MILLLDGNSKMGAHKEQSLLSDLFKAFAYIMISHKSEFFLRKYLKFYSFWANI